MRHFGVIICITAILMGFSMSSQAQFSLSGQIRPRAEFRDGYRQLGDQSTVPAFFISQRSRLNLHYRDSALETHISLQDVRVWGDETHLQDVPSTALHEAWGRIHFNGQWALKAGRQELVYGNHRLLGNVGWTQQARSHDAAVVQWRPGNWAIDVGGAYNQMSERVTDRIYTMNNYKTLGFVWLEKPVSDELKVSFAGINDGFQATDTANKQNFRYTAGPILQYAPGGLLFKGEFFGQTGKTPAGQDLNAFLFSLQAGFDKKAFNSKVGIDYVSGTKEGINNEVNTFSTLYATNHKFYGLMDHFLNITNDTRNGGLQDLYLKAGYQLSGRAGIGLDVHHFSLANQIADPENTNDKLEKHLGWELDATGVYRLNSMVQLKGGYSCLLPAASLESIEDGNKNTWQQWAWVMVNMTPTFFKQ